MLTIFTPTFNRAYIIKNLYDSLTAQTNKDFEWLIVDDGSSDNTEEIISSFALERKINIRYYKQKNGGKHRAINYGVPLAKGEFFFIVDSDDYLPNDSIETIRSYTNQIADDNRFAGVCGLRIYADGRKIGGESNYDIIDTDMISIREKYHVRGDMAEVFRTSILKEYPFPAFDGEKFISEGVVWSEIAQKYDLRFFYKGIYICDYLVDGLTKSIRVHHRNSPKGSMLTYNSTIRRSNTRIKTKIIAATNYWRYTINYKGNRDGELSPIWWTYLFYPLGYFFYKRDLCS